jgi:predicted PilT family ATPase
VVIDVPKEYIPFVLGLGSANKEKIETKTETKIIVPPRNGRYNRKKSKVNIYFLFNIDGYCQP